MKIAHCIAVAALALAPLSAGVDAQGKSKPKEKPASAQPAQQPDAEQGKAKGKKPDTPAPAGAAGVAGAGACTPDKTAPVIQSVSATPAVLSTPNHKMTPVTIRANVTDNCSTPKWSVTAVASNEPVNGTGDGDTEPDWTISGDHGVTLRAERAGTGGGRVYNITIVARDAAGNTSNSTTTVRVPHNR